MPKPCKIAIFYDGQFLNLISNYYYFNSDLRGKIWMSAMQDLIREEISKIEGIPSSLCRLVDTQLFRGRHSAPAAQNREMLFSDRMFEDNCTRAGILNNYRIFKYHDDSFEEKGIDVWLALTAYEQTLRNQYDYVVLFAGDADFEPLVDRLACLGTQVVIPKWDFLYQNDGQERVIRTSNRLLRKASHVINLAHIIEFPSEDQKVMVDAVLSRREQERNDRIEESLGIDSYVVASSVNENTTLDMHHSVQDAASTEAPANTEPMSFEMTGSVLSYNVDRNYGFIKPDDGNGSNNIFFHKSEYHSNECLAPLNQRVKFNTEQTNRGVIAKCIFNEDQVVYEAPKRK